MLSHWDIMPSDLHDFYHFLDRDGDGIDIFEFLDYVKKVSRPLAEEALQSMDIGTACQAQGLRGSPEHDGGRES